MQQDPLPLGALRWRCRVEDLGFESTESLEDIADVIGQDRAVEAVQFGIGMDNAGYNIFALGPDGLNKHTIVRQHLDAAARGREVPPDRAYVNNFDEPYKPLALKLPAGRGADFKQDTDKMVDELLDALRSAFESEDYRTRRRMLESEFKERQERAIGEVEQEARDRNIALQRTPAGFAFAPMRDGQVLDSDGFHQLPDEEKQKIQQEVEQLQHRLHEALQNMPHWVKETREELRKVNEETASYAVGHMIEALKRKYDPLTQVQEHLDRVRADIVNNVDTLLATARQEEQGGAANPQMAAQMQRAESLMNRYRINLIVDNAELEAAPVVYADDPTYEHLIGRIEHRAEMGALTTDFHLIRPGTLHRANGGYLVIDARKVLTRPLAWDALKRILRGRELRIESPYQALGLLSTTTLEPEPLPLDVKVVMIGERLIYYLLNELDPEFRELFKVAADFDERTDLTEENLPIYARMIATLARKNHLPAFSAEGVGRVIEESARLASDQEKLSIELEKVSDLLREATYQARQNGDGIVGAKAVDAAVAARDRRLGRMRERLQEEILRDTILIDTDGSAVGQINALSVLSLGGYAFGKPTRVSARVGLGRGNVVDIEREVELGGPIHSKGVLILAGFLASRFALEQPLSLSASLVFEQSYGGIEGDSASLAELLVLLSAIGEVPLRQDLAVTGSVNQHGGVQAIGGANEKIESFFELCSTRGLTGHQGVVIPDSNVKHLMLRGEVLDAVEAGRFHVFSVKTVDQAAVLLTGLEAGEANEHGRFPFGSLNGGVQQRLEALAERRRRFGQPDSRLNERPQEL